MNTAVDPFTAASPTYHNALRYPYRSGSAFEVSTRPLNWRLILCVALNVAVVVALVGVVVGAGR